MFSKRSRLSKEAFSETYKSGKRISNRFFTLIYNGFSEQPARFSVVVSKKVASKATERNTLRRRVYAALRTLPHLPQSGVYVFFVKKDARALLFTERQHAAQELLEKTLAPHA